ISSKRQVVPIWLKVEQYARSLIDAARQSLKSHSDFTAPEILHVRCHGVRVVSESLNPIEKLGVALAVQRSRFVGESGGGLPFFPLPTIDGEDVFSTFAFDAPNADDRYERLRIRTNRFIGKFELHRLSCQWRRSELCQAEH